jgi:hypothetical protein
MSPENRKLLERKFGRKLPEGDPKVTLTVSAIAQLLDAAREEGAKRTKADASMDRLREVYRKAGMNLGI